GPRVACEVVGFDDAQTIVLPLGSVAGIRRGDAVATGQHAQYVNVSDALLGRVLNGRGETIDGRGSLADAAPRPLHPGPIDPLDRPTISQSLATGVRTIDSLISVGRGQRLGVFAAPGVGKSTLLGMMARQTAADVSVIALVGERGREVRDFIEQVMGSDGLARSVVICATGDEPSLIRIRAAYTAMTVAEYFRDQGLDVLFIMDSITRFCHAQRQIGLSAGEPPATRGYPPSVFSILPTLLERCGRTSVGSITGFFSVLVEGDDMNEPISDACRGILDGHVLLSRKLAERGYYPAIDPLGSISRVADDVTDRQHQQARQQVLRLLSAYQDVEDLLNIGAYAAGSNPDFDLAIACKPAIDRMLQQGRKEQQGTADFDKTKAMLLALNQQIEQAKAELTKQNQRVSGAMPG
ncbi:MAG: FliI/YscN family ATPase, partial [Rhodospirillales bacterium]|nr:FliI/YscN family ATPase [Rhodospirillales bacterium]